jgi:hypothetical protein
VPTAPGLRSMRWPPWTTCVPRPIAGLINSSSRRRGASQRVRAKRVESGLGRVTDRIDRDQTPSGRGQGPRMQHFHNGAARQGPARPDRHSICSRHGLLSTVADASDSATDWMLLPILLERRKSALRKFSSRSTAGVRVHRPASGGHMYGLTSHWFPKCGGMATAQHGYQRALEDPTTCEPIDHSPARWMCCSTSWSCAVGEKST